MTELHANRRVTFQSMADRLTLGLLAAVIGSVLVFVSAFLTWSTVDARSFAGRKIAGAVTDSLGIAGGRLGRETLVLSIASLAMVAVMLLPASKDWAWKVLLGFGALTVLFALVDLLSIPRTLRPGNFTCPSGVTCSFHRSVGPGVWFTLVAGVVVVAGAYVHHIRPVAFRPHEAAESAESGDAVSADAVPEDAESADAAPKDAAAADDLPAETVPAGNAEDAPSEHG